MPQRSKSPARSTRKTRVRPKSAASPRTPTCFDDPERMASRDFRACILAVSKDLREGQLRRARPAGGFLECRDLELPDRRRGCRTLKTVHKLLFRAIVPHDDCDSAISRALEFDQATGKGPLGELLVSPLVTLFDENGLGRGIHAGNFLWRGPNYLKIRGRMSGTTNAGLYRAPVFDSVEKCRQMHVLYGRLCGRVETLDARLLSQLAGSQLIGTYRILIRADPAEGEDGLPGSNAVEGVFEGAFIRVCR